MPRTVGAVCAGLLLVILCLPNVASSTAFDVTTTSEGSDSNPGDGVCATSGGECSLRAAAQEADAWPGPDVVRVPAGTFSLSTPGTGEFGALRVTDELTVEGARRAVTVLDGQRLSRIFYVEDPGMLTLVDLTLQNGEDSIGGAVYATFETSVVLERVVVRDNHATLASAVLALQIEARDCHFVGNTGGAALWAISGSVERCTFEGSGSSGYPFAGDLGTGFGAGADDVLSVRNSTFTGTIGNVAVCDRVGCGSGGDLELSNVTADSVIFQTAGGAPPGAITLTNTVVRRCSGGVFQSGGHNLIQELPSCTIEGDLTGNRAGIDPLLGPLVDNGGATPSRLPLAGSPLLSGGSPSVPGSSTGACEVEDQRGLARPQGSRCDIGAAEGACGDGSLDFGEECDDGNAIDGDGCDRNCTPTGCGNRIVSAGEQCDDGNTSPLDCCSSSCQLDAPGAACAADENECTDDVCDGAGTCTHPDNTIACDDGSPCTHDDQCRGGQCFGIACDTCHDCDPILGCVMPEPTCLPTAAGSSRLRARKGKDSDGDRVSFRWTSPVPTDKALLGNPRMSGPWQLCVFDRSGEVVVNGLLTGGTPFLERERAWRYRDRERELGNQTITAGDLYVSEKTAVRVRGHGANLGLPEFPLELPLTARVVAHQEDTCVEAVFDQGVVVNRGRTFRARSE